MITRYKGEDHPQYFDEAFSHFETFVFKIVSDADPPFWVAGGAPLSFFRGTPINDLDMYFSSEIALKLVADRLKGCFGYYVTYQDNFHCIMTSQTAELNVDLIKRPFDSAEDVLAAFDFTVCQCAIGKNEITYSDSYFEHIATRSLYFTDYALNRPAYTLRRLMKYAHKGFKISDKELARLLEPLTKLDLEDPNENFSLRSKWNNGDSDIEYIQLGQINEFSLTPF